MKTMISIERAVNLTESCLCCNTIQEIKEKLEDYNRKNNTDYSVEIQYILYTTSDCTRCNLVKNMINGQNLNIILKESNEKDIKYLADNGNSGFPVLEIKAGEKVEYVDGPKVGEFIASNLNMFK